MKIRGSAFPKAGNTTLVTRINVQPHELRQQFVLDEAPAGWIIQKCGAAYVADAGNAIGEYQVTATVIVEIPGIHMIADSFGIAVIVF